MKAKQYDGGILKDWYCRIDDNGNAEGSKQCFIGTLGGLITLYHKSNLGENYNKGLIFKKIEELDFATIERIVNQQGYCMADRQLSQIPPRMQINEYTRKNIESIKVANPKIFTNK